ncbi:hypothetical protein NUACC26_087080 [Scytonema sp. NUACC26]
MSNHNPITVKIDSQTTYICNLEGWVLEKRFKREFMRSAFLNSHDYETGNKTYITKTLSWKFQQEIIM